MPCKAKCKSGLKKYTYAEYDKAYIKAHMDNMFDLWEHEARSPFMRYLKGEDWRAPCDCRVCKKNETTNSAQASKEEGQVASPNNE